MSILIAGMEMPESCYYCPFADGTWGYSPPHRKRCVITGKDMPVDERGVQHNQSCPLVHVQPHGRLIDVDAPLRFVVTVDAKMNHATVDIIAPTVMEAEEAEPFNNLAKPYKAEED